MSLVVSFFLTPSKSPPEGETLKDFFKALSFGEGWVSLLFSQHFRIFI